MRLRSMVKAWFVVITFAGCARTRRRMTKSCFKKEVEGLGPFRAGRDGGDHRSAGSQSFVYGEVNGGWEDDGFWETWTPTF